MEKKESESDDGEGSTTKDGYAEKGEVFEVGSVPLHCTRESETIMSSTISQKAHRVEVCEENVHFCIRWSLYGDALCHENCGGCYKIPTKHPWWTDEINEISWFSQTEKIYVTVTGKLRRKIVV